jgi:hypothetical protein
MRNEHHHSATTTATARAALAAAALLAAAPAANAIGGVADMAFSFGYSAIVNDPQRSDNTTFHGVSLSGGVLLADHHEIAVETGFYVGDRGIHESWGERYNREIYDRENYLVPFLVSYNYVQKFALDHVILQAGPVGGMFVATGHESWGSYDGRDYGHDDGWYSHDSYSESDVLWAAGAQAGVSLKLPLSFYVHLGYRFLYASSYEVFGVRPGPSRNHQVTLSAELRF